jgi:hypothetical protein
MSGIVTKLLLVAVAILAPCGVVRPASAQEVPLSQFLPNFITTATDLDETLTPADHVGHFRLDSQLQELPRALNQALAIQLATFPSPNDWPGVRSGSRTGDTPAAHRAVFASSLSERGVTSGAGRLSIGFSHHTAQFKWLDDLDLRKGVELFFRHSDTSNPALIGDGDVEAERDVLRQTVSLRLDRTVFNFALSYGVSDRVDIGVMVPVAKVSFDGRITARVLRRATAGTPEVHTFDRLELDNKTTYATRNVHGIGDIFVRTKLQLLGSEEGGVAASLGARLPTGREEDFLGTGSFGTEAALMWSMRRGAVAPHARASYSRSFGDISTDFGLDDPGTLPVDVGAAAGLDVSFHPRWTMTGDVMGRWLRDTTRFAAGDVTLPFRVPEAATVPFGEPFTATEAAFVTGRSQSLSQVYVAIGTKILVGQQILFHGDVVLPLVRNGLTPRPMVVVGVGTAF